LLAELADRLAVAIVPKEGDHVFGENIGIGIGSFIPVSMVNMRQGC
jgi:hypothetical protein